MRALRRSRKQDMLTQERLRSILDYDPQTGNWMWCNRSDRNAKWNRKWAGKPAGTINNHGYLRIKIKIDDIDRLYSGHRLAFLYMIGKWPEDEVDHRNLDRSDCRWENIRPATRSYNNLNHPIRSDNVSGYKGVSFDTTNKKYIGQITIEGCCYRRYFDTPEKAYAFYCQNVIALGKGFGRVA